MKSNRLSLVLLLILPLVISIFIAPNGVQFLLGKWLDFDHGPYNHGFLLLFIAIYLLSKRIDLNKDLTFEANVLGFCLSCILLLAVFVFGIINIAIAQVLAMFLLVYSLILTFYGWVVFKKSIIPLAFILFAIPIWDGLSPVLQWITAEMSYLMVKAAGIAALKDGYYIMVPAGSFEVAASCSGFSYLMAALPLSLLYAITNFRSKRRIVLVIAVIVISSIIANWVRVLVIIVAGQMTNMQHYFITVEHFNLGWFIFGLFFITLIYFFNRTSDLNSANDEERPVEVSLSRRETKINVRLIIFSISLSLIALLAVAAHHVGDSRANAVHMADISVPDSFSHTPALYPLEPTVEGAVEKYFVSYDYGQPIQIYHGFIKFQVQGEEVISSLNTLYSDKWQLINRSKGLSGKIIKAELIYSLTGERYLLWSWYKVDGTNTASGILAKWYELLGYLKGDNSGSIVSVLSPQVEGVEDNFRSIYRDLNDGAL